MLQSDASALCMQGISTTAAPSAAHCAVRTIYTCHLQKFMFLLPLHVIMAARTAAETLDNNFPQSQSVCQVLLFNRLYAALMDHETAHWFYDF